MKFRLGVVRLSLLCLSLLSLSSGLALQAADGMVTYQSLPGSKVRIEGTSSIHPWTVESQIIGGTIEFDARLIPTPTEGVKVVPKVDVTIPVRSLKSGKTPMDDVMHNAMKQAQFPKIGYKLKEIAVKEAPTTAGGPIKFDTKGELTVAGVTRTNAMEVTFQPMPSDKLKIVGSTNLKMTDFGIKPPAPAIGLGLITTEDDVKITFEWVTTKKQ